MADSKRIAETAGTEEASSPGMSKRRRTIFLRNPQLPLSLSLNSPTDLKCRPASYDDSCLCSSSDHFDDDRCCCRSNVLNEDDDDVKEKESSQRVDLEVPNSKTVGANSTEDIDFSKQKPSDEPCANSAGEPAPADEPVLANDGGEELGTRINSPLTDELDEFFANAERNQQKYFTEKYNFDFVNDAPPLTDELDEFFANAERNQQKYFTEKYNFDFVNDAPLEGRYEWLPLTP